ncbi:DUF4876 domain-containing protein [Apibacter sp. HY039]|uniref:DUF4876 domain-containing protein n=1 Tax=Apibacter sp. HY039 TaxID=2501476 RepID=UPI000FEBAC34|nr:DUF4876 domain-containing protein [Apibacter sp. HY039]
MKKINTFLNYILILFFTISCSNDDSYDVNSSNLTSVELKLLIPEDEKTYEIENLEVYFKEINSGIETKIESKSLSIKIDLNSGNYKISVQGSIKKENNLIKLTGIQESVLISGTHQIITLQLLKSIISNNDLLIEEIYYTGSKNSLTGIPYFGDRYFKIFNNSDQIVYADGLLLAESEFTTNDKKDYSPDIMNDAFAAGGVIILPGKGKEYPIQPGTSIIIAESANNHKSINSNYINLSFANFEMYNPYDDETVDNPLVPNTEFLFNSVSIDKKGVRSYIIARLPSTVSKEKFLTDYRYHYTYSEWGYPMEGDAMSIPNDWIIDAVNLSNGKDPDWILTSSSLDNGWTTCSLHEGDESRYGKSVKRKPIDSQPITKLKDTNNSKDDFEAVTPSLKNE